MCPRFDRFCLNPLNFCARSIRPFFARDLIHSHDFKSLQLSIFDEQYNLFDDIVNEAIWTKSVISLDGFFFYGDV